SPTPLKPTTPIPTPLEQTTLKTYLKPTTSKPTPKTGSSETAYHWQ
ncbi:hypothetical protein A2U01_0081043, partial [Trifolium medium]|nr:hypothetical protein [Trifolium medium]